jgi:hypothetical protein
MQIKGKVVYVDLSGGFWGIVSEDGQQFDPVNEIPEAFRKDGLEISAKVKPSPGFSIRMWGQMVNVSGIKVK